MPLIPLLLPLTPKYLPGRPAPSTPSKSSTPSFPHDPTTKKPPSSIPVANATRPPPPPELPGGGDLEGYPEHCRPRNGDGVVLYTTTLRGVRRAVEAYTYGGGGAAGRVAPLEAYLKEVMELSGEGAAVPRLFKRGRYVGGVEEVVELGETGKLREMLWVAVRGERGKGGWRECEGCGGARVVPCLECNGAARWWRTGRRWRGAGSAMTMGWCCAHFVIRAGGDARNLIKPSGGWLN